jgi:hypothetical protein
MFVLRAITCDGEEVFHIMVLVMHSTIGINSSYLANFGRNWKRLAGVASPFVFSEEATEYMALKSPAAADSYHKVCYLPSSKKTHCVLVYMSKG